MALSGPRRFPFPDHRSAIEVVLKDLEANGVKIEGIGHRIVQGGWYFGDSSLVDEDVLAKIREVAPLAPLHNNPEAATLSSTAWSSIPTCPTSRSTTPAFHFNMPEVAKTYALPKDVCDKLHIRKYGAHGTSYRYISKKVAEMTNGEARKVVVCHHRLRCFPVRHRGRQVHATPPWASRRSTAS